MDSKVVYQNSDGGISILHPTKECGFPIERIAQKDVPDGVGFWIIDASELPADRSFRSAWELDAQAMGSPHGVGDTAAFTAWQAEKEGNNQ